MTTPSTNLTILHDTQEWSTDIEGEIGEIRVDGKRLDDIHDLSSKLEKSNIYIVEVTKRIKVMAYIATALAVLAVTFTTYIGGWLVANQDQISERLVTEGEAVKLKRTNRNLANKLESLGWVWKDGRWQHTGNTHSRVSR